MNYNIDIKKIAEELDFDIEDVEMLIEVFLNSAFELLEQLSNGIDKNDLEEIFQASHAIKGSSANLTLMDISDLAKDIEMSAKNREQIDYKSKYIQLKNLIKTSTIPY